jgi:hypothetical protein
MDAKNFNLMLESLLKAQDSDIDVLNIEATLPPPAFLHSFNVPISQEQWQVPKRAPAKPPPHSLPQNPPQTQPQKHPRLLRKVSFHCS